MLCEICKTAESKYKCPKCSIPYCSIPCYKSAEHIHPQVDLTQPVANPTVTQEITEEEGKIQSKWEKIANDEIIRKLLAEPALQIHLLTILKILKDDKIVSNVSDDQRLEIARLKLTDLRAGGIEENVLVEEFVNRALDLLS